MNNLIVYAFFAGALVVAIVSLYISSRWLPRKMENAYRNALRTLATAVETKDSRTLGHAERVAETVVQIAHKFDLPKEEVKLARYAALLRDIGKSAVPHAILNKEGALTDGELRVVRGHAREGAAIVEQVAMLAPLRDSILHHHEHWDGTGYPECLAGTEIPLVARIISVVDDYEGMISERPYHSAMPAEDANAQIQAGSGTLYDPEVVKAFLEVVGMVPYPLAAEEAAAA